MNLINDSWIPVRNKNGDKIKISPKQITEKIKTDLEYVDVSSVRPDFDGALLQFLIGLLQTTCAPNNTEEWYSWFNKPPDENDLQIKFSTISEYFNLNGDGPLFMQEINLKYNTHKTELISKMFVDMPGENTIKKNRDFFIKDGKIFHICLPCAAAVLFTMQINAPIGGSGYLAGLRGGGPLTTVIIGRNLWETCWLNVLNKNDFLSLANKSKNQDSDKFPWITCERININGLTTTSEDVHPFQIYWSMPKRYLLIVEEINSSICDLCGEYSDVYVSEYLCLPKGVKYNGQWRHPLSPMYKNHENEWLHVHQHERLGYKHWLGLIPNISTENKQPALVINKTSDRRIELQRELQIKAFGYDMKKAEASAWNESVFPLVNIKEQQYRQMYEYCITNILRAADLACNYLRKALKEALKKKTVSKDASNLFWEKTEAFFYNTETNLRCFIQEETGALPENALESWLKTIIYASQAIFDIFSQSEYFKVIDTKRVAEAWNKMNYNLYGKTMRDTLGLPIKNKEVTNAK